MVFTLIDVLRRPAPQTIEAKLALRDPIPMPKIGSGQCDSWTANELLADRDADRRVILAGDACHLHRPAGGYGMNMGVGDGVGLGWKIASRLQGLGGPELIPSYEAERGPVHRKVMDEAMANYAIYVAPPPPEIEDDTAQGSAIRAKVGAGVQQGKSREFATLGTVLGLF